jgi:predicted permease
MTYVRATFSMVIITSVGVLIALYTGGSQQSAVEVLGRMFRNPVYWVVLTATALRAYRRVNFRLGDTDDQGQEVRKLGADLL